MTAAARIFASATQDVERKRLKEKYKDVPANQDVRLLDLLDKHVSFRNICGFNTGRVQLFYQSESRSVEVRKSSFQSPLGLTGPDW